MIEILSSCWLLFVALAWVPFLIWVFWDRE